MYVKRPSTEETSFHVHGPEHDASREKNIILLSNEDKNQVILLILEEIAIGASA
jgi:hypothetical protein